MGKSGGKHGGGCGCLGALFLIVIGVALGIGGHIWYQNQDRPTQEKFKAVALNAIDWLRESKHTPRDARYFLDKAAGYVPLDAAYKAGLTQHNLVKPVC